jgi:polysaccharide export outer membrane protein
MGLIRYPVIVCFCVFWAPLLAQSQGGLIARPPAAPDYVLGPGDSMAIHVIDMEDEIPDRPVRIDPNGFLDIPLVGRFHASGLTLEQFKSDLAGRLAKYITNPRISLSLTDNQGRSITVIGAVNSPGVHQMPGPERLIEVLALAGGPKEDAGPRVILTREQKWGKIPLPDAVVDPVTGNSTAYLSLDELQASKNPSDNILMYPNDIISIPKAEIVYVTGDVKKASGFQLSSHPTISLTQALSLAGGMDKDAAPGSARILRQAPGGDGKRIDIQVDITQIFAGKAVDVALQGNDVLYIPTSAVKSGARRAAEAIIQAATGVAIYRF